MKAETTQDALHLLSKRAGRAEQAQAIGRDYAAVVGNLQFPWHPFVRGISPTKDGIPAQKEKQTSHCLPASGAGDGN